MEIEEFIEIVAAFQSSLIPFKARVLTQIHMVRKVGNLWD